LTVTKGGELPKGKMRTTRQPGLVNSGSSCAAKDFRTAVAWPRSGGGSRAIDNFVSQQGLVRGFVVGQPTRLNWDISDHFPIRATVRVPGAARLSSSPSHMTHTGESSTVLPNRPRRLTIPTRAKQSRALEIVGHAKFASLRARNEAVPNGRFITAEAALASAAEDDSDEDGRNDYEQAVRQVLEEELDMAVRDLREATDAVISDPEMQLSKAASEATMASKGHSRLSRPAAHAIKARRALAAKLETFTTGSASFNAAMDEYLEVRKQCNQIIKRELRAGECGNSATRS
jgi:hypothetical protein